MIVDTHLHVWELSNDQFPWTPLATVAPDYAWPVENEVQIMDRYGIEKGVLVQPSMYRWDNGYLLDCARRFPGRFGLVGLVNPASSNVVEEMATLASQGVGGLRLGPMLRPDIDWYNTPESDRVWQKAGELGLIITLLIIPEQIAAAREAIRRYPNTRVIVDHLARPDRADSPQAIEDLFTLAEFDWVFLKVSALGYMSRLPYPHEDMLSLVRQVYQSFGAQRLMWGTDTPMSQKPEDIPAALKLIDLALPTIPQADIDWIKGNTAARLFGWL